MAGKVAVGGQDGHGANVGVAHIHLFGIIEGVADACCGKVAVVQDAALEGVAVGAEECLSLKMDAPFQLGAEEYIIVLARVRAHRLLPLPVGQDAA